MPSNQHGSGPFDSRPYAIFFVHLPKTGGTAVNRFFTEHLARYGSRNIELYLAGELTAERLREPGFRERTFAERMRLLTQTPERGLFYVRYHHGAPGLLLVQQTLCEVKQAFARRGGKLLVCTALREPYSRMISDLKFNRIPPQHIERRLKIIEDFMTKYMLFNQPPYWPDDADMLRDADVQRVVDLFDVVGLQSDLSGFVRRVLESAGLPSAGVRVPRVNVTKSVQKLPHIDRDEFERRNPRDVRLYRALALRAQR